MDISPKDVTDLPLLAPTELEGVQVINLQYSRTKTGAIHHLPLSPLCDSLMVWELFDLDITHQEVDRLHSVTRIVACSTPIALLPTVGKWLAVVMSSHGVVAEFKLRPIEGLIVPGGFFFGLQSLERNRVSFTRVTRRDNTVVAELPADDPKLFHYWEAGQGDPAYDYNGKRLQPPS